MGKGPITQTPAESKAQLVQKIKAGLRSGDYSRALDLLRSAAVDFPGDGELTDLEGVAQHGIKRKAEADRLITQSQELFAEQKSAEAIQLLRQAYELDKHNSLARAILANALVEQADSIVETDWLEAEKLANQSLGLNPAHPTAKTILSRIVEHKKNSSVEDWVSQASKLQSSGDLFTALAWVAEGLAVHPEDPKLLGIQDSIQRDQGARRRQARRRDLEDLRRMELEIGGTADEAAKQVLAERIQGVAAKYWTDGEMLSIANVLLQKLGLDTQNGPIASPNRRKGTVIFHVPRPSVAKAPDKTPSPVAASPVLVSHAPPAIRSSPANRSSEIVETTVSAPQISTNVVPSRTTATVVQESQVAPPKPLPASVRETSTSTAKGASGSSKAKQPAKSNFKTFIAVSTAAAVIVLVAAGFFFARKHHAPAVANAPSAIPAVPSPATSAAPTVPVVSVPAPTTSAPVESIIPETSLPDSPQSSVSGDGKVRGDEPLSPGSVHELGTLLVVANQDDATVLLNGKIQRQLTRAGQLRVPNLEPKDHVVQVSKRGFQDPPQQTIRIRKGDQAKLIFNLQPLPRLAMLSIQGGAPGTTVLIDQNPAGTIQSDGTLSVSTVSPGDHTVELRKERFRTRQFKRHFVAGGAVSLAAADALLEAAPGELKITFAPADAKVALVKGDALTIVSSGTPLSLTAGTYTLTARTADRVTRSSTVEVVAGQSKALDLSLAPTGMSKWDNPGAWKQERDSFVRKGGDFVLYGVSPTSGTFIFSAMPTKGRLLQWVLNYTDSRNYVLCQMDENGFYRTIIRNGEKSDEIRVPDKGDKKSFRTLHIRITPTEVVHQIKHGDSWVVLDRWTRPGANFGSGRFGFYIPGSDEVSVSSFAHYADLNTR